MPMRPEKREIEDAIIDKYKRRFMTAQRSFLNSNQALETRLRGWQQASELTPLSMMLQAGDWYGSRASQGSTRLYVMSMMAFPGSDLEGAYSKLQTFAADA